MLADSETQRSQCPGKTLSEKGSDPPAVKGADPFSDTAETEIPVGRCEPTSARDNTPLPIPRRRRSLSWKRGMDVGLSLAALVVAAPVLLLASALVKLASRGPVF